MLLGVDESEDLRVEPLKVQRPLAALVGVGIAGFVGTAIIVSRALFSSRGDLGEPEQNIGELARSVFSDSVFAFELTSVLLVIAVVGTVLLARRPRSKADR
jgi:NADH-quinone oxidoreductase subunit J